MKIKISKKQWEEAGQKAGWIKKGQTEDLEIFRNDRSSSPAGDAVRDHLGIQPGTKGGNDTPASSGEYKGFTINIYPTSARKSYYYVEIDGVLIPNDFTSTPKWQGQGLSNAIERGKIAIDKAIMENPHGADKSTILKSLGKWRDF